MISKLVRMYKNRQESKRYYSFTKYRGMIALILLIFLVLGSSEQASSFSTGLLESISIAIPSDQVSHESIIIASDSDFISQGWPGNGSISNPFLIEGLAILSDDECVKIANTSSYFVIRNCSLSGMLDHHGIGVYLRNVTHGTIELSTMSGLGVGIYDRQSTGNVYRNNTIEDTWDGILIDICNNNVVSNNTVTENRGGDEIWIINSRNCLVLGNFVSGICLTWSTTCTVGHNYGLIEGLNIEGNNLTHWLHQIHDNYFNGKMLGYFRDSSDSIIDGDLYSQLILVNVTRTMISGGIFQNLSMGVQIINSADCTLSDFVSKNNFRVGVNIKNSYNCTIVNGSVDEHLIGMSVWSSEMTRVEGTQMNNNSFCGIEVISSNSCHFIENTISNGRSGVSIYMSNNCTLSENDIFGNEVGVVLSSSNYTLITNNIVHENEIGIILSSTTSHNLIYWNSFILNTDKNAVDDGLFNVWDDGISRGNIWSDYQWPGPYTIPGEAQSIDRFPNVPFSQIPPEIIPAGFIIIIAVLIYSQKERFRTLKEQAC